MHSLGNDFVVLDQVTQHFQLTAEQVQKLGDRRTGIGFDQLLVIAPPQDPAADFCYHIYNSDGSTAQQCGNGTRAVALLAQLAGLSRKPTLVWQSLAGTIQTTFSSAQNIETVMTTPVLALDEIPFDRTQSQAYEHASGFRQFSLEHNNVSFVVTPVSMGNPHGVIVVDDLFNTAVDEIGGALTAHPAFPERANIGFCQVVDAQFIRLRVYERGTGETRACGSGACAAVVATHSLGLTDDHVKVSMPGGKLKISWPSVGSPVTMSGSAVLVFQGNLSLDDLRQTTALLHNEQRGPNEQSGPNEQRGPAQQGVSDQQKGSD